MTDHFSVTQGLEISVRDYQEMLISKTRELMQRKSKRVVLVAPTGAGKTRMSAWIANSVIQKGKKAIFAVHRRDLVFQAYNAYQELGIDCGLIIAGTPYEPFKSVQIASIDTVHARRGYLDFLSNYDLLVMDEAHTALSNKFQSLRDLCPDAFEIGLTATPARSDGRGLGSIYGAMADGISYKWLIDNNYLVMPRYVWDKQSQSELLKLNASGEFTESSQESAFENLVQEGKKNLIGGVVGHYEKHAKGRPFVFFAPSVRASIRICEQFNEAGYTVVHIDANTPREVREAAYSGVKDGSVHGLCNYGVLDRGFDVPVISCVIVMREVKHIGNWLQIIGRGLRTAEGKTDCIILDLGENVLRHGDAVYKQPVEWTLDESTSVTEQHAEVVAKEPKPIICKGCKTAYYFKENKSCPNCGLEPQPSEIKASLPETREAELAEGEIPQRVDFAIKQDWYAQLIFYADFKGYQRGWADHAYKEKFGVWCKDKRVTPKPLTEEVKRYIKYLNIKRAKARQSRRNERLANAAD